MTTTMTRAQILAAKHADATLGEQPLTPGGDRERKRALYRQPGVTGKYVTRASRRQDEAYPPDDKVWTWYAREPAFRGRTVGEWRKEAEDPEGRLDAKYMLLRGDDEDLIVRGSREQVFTGAAHVTDTSARLMYTDLCRHPRTSKVISARRSAHARRSLAKSA